MKRLSLPNEDVWALKAVGSLSSVNALQGFDNIEQSFPEEYNVRTESRRVGGAEKIFERAAIGVLQEDIIGATLPVTS